MSVKLPWLESTRLMLRLSRSMTQNQRKVISVENYNTLAVPVVGRLSLTVRQNNFLYRVDRIRGAPVEGVAVRTDLTVGFSYGLDWKWF